MKTSLFFLRQQQALTPICLENKIVEQEKLTLRSKYKYDSSDFIILCIAEFIPRKGHDFFIENISELKRQIPNLKVIMPSRGVQHGNNALGAAGNNNKTRNYWKKNLEQKESEISII